MKVNSKVNDPKHQANGAIKLLVLHKVRLIQKMFPTNALALSRTKFKLQPLEIIDI